MHFDNRGLPLSTIGPNTKKAAFPGCGRHADPRANGMELSERTTAGVLEGLMPRTDAPAGAVLLAVFTATLFLSALLLFAVQPVFAKMILPRLGGAPSVWAVSMCFFQAVLLAGYGYAFALNRWL